MRELEFSAKKDVDGGYNAVAIVNSCELTCPYIKAPCHTSCAVFAERLIECEGEGFEVGDIVLLCSYGGIDEVMLGVLKGHK